MHFRGCSGEHNRLQRGYHSGDTGDIGYLVDTMRARFPEQKLAAIGYSLGGNALLKYLGEADRAEKISAAAAVSVIYCLKVGAKKLNRGLSRGYQRHLIVSLRKKLLDKFTRLPPAIRVDHLRTLKNFYDFDNQITAPLHGFADADDYYARSSSRQYLGTITVPTLLLHAEDDPFMTADAIPQASELSSRVRLELSRHGRACRLCQWALSVASGVLAGAADPGISQANTCDPMNGLLQQSRPVLFADCPALYRPARLRLLPAIWPRPGNPARCAILQTHCLHGLCCCSACLGLLHGHLLAGLGKTGRQVYSGLAGISAGIGAGLAGRQVWLQHLPAEQVPECGPGLDFLLQAFPFFEAIALILTEGR